jgi:hypothetical protein
VPPRERASHPFVTFTPPRFYQMKPCEILALPVARERTSATSLSDTSRAATSGVHRKRSNHFDRIESDDLAQHQQLDNVQAAFAAFVLANERLVTFQFICHGLLRKTAYLSALDEQFQEVAIALGI